ncbi:MAG: TetR family transcriptional regulator [Thermodesulfobacteriota bacterium]
MGMPAPAEHGRTARERQRVETRERLFRAALAELRRHGVEGAQVERIVAAARVSRGSFYFHFPTRDDVLLEWERRREAEIVARLQERGGGAALERRPLRDALLALVTSLDALVGSTDGRLLLDTLAIHVRRASDPASYPLLDEIERRLAQAQERGELRADVDARRGAILFLSNVFGFLVARVTSRPPHPDATLLVDVFLSGVTARRRAAARPAGGARRRRRG